jgi:galactokinase
VVEENIRLLEGCEDLRHGNLEALGKKMFASHYGLTKEYEVSCKELDFLVEFVSGNKNVAGARMMGGGFGGCTINLVKEEAVQDLVEAATEAFNREMKNDLIAYVAETGDGTTIMDIH